MAKVLTQLSSFLRVLPIPSHNLSEQLLKLEYFKTVYKYTAFVCFILVYSWQKYLLKTKEQIIYIYHIKSIQIPDLSSSEKSEDYYLLPTRILVVDFHRSRMTVALRNSKSYLP